MAISLFGVAVNPADNGTNTTSPAAITPPASMQAGDVCIVYVQSRLAGTSTYDQNISATGGQFWHMLSPDLRNGACGVNVWACRFNGTWSANPSFTGFTCISVVMTVWRSNSAGQLIDIDKWPRATNFAAGTTPFTKTNAGITTNNNNAVIVTSWHSSDDNTWGNLTAGWSQTGLSAQYRNLGGSDQSMAVAYKTLATAGATGSVSMDQTVNGGDAGGTYILSLYERADNYLSTPPAVDLYNGFETSSDGTNISTSILGADTHATGGGPWTVSGTNPNVYKIASAGERNFDGGKKITEGGTGFPDTSGTLGTSYDHTLGTDVTKYDWNLAASVNAISVGYFYNTTHAFDDFSNFAFNDIWQVGEVEWAVFNLQPDQAAQHTTLLECAGQNAWGPSIQTSHWYWVSVKMDTVKGLAYMAIFDVQDSWKQLGFTMVNECSTANKAGLFTFGCGGGNFAAATGVSLCDDLIADWTTAAFPLGPAVGSASSSTARIVLIPFAIQRASVY